MVVILGNMLLPETLAPLASPSPAEVDALFSTATVPPCPRIEALDDLRADDGPSDICA